MCGETSLLKIQMLSHHCIGDGNKNCPTVHQHHFIQLLLSSHRICQSLSFASAKLSVRPAVSVLGISSPVCFSVGAKVCALILPR